VFAFMGGGGGCTHETCPSHLTLGPISFQEPESQLENHVAAPLPMAKRAFLGFGDV